MPRTVGERVAGLRYDAGCVAYDCDPRRPDIADASAGAAGAQAAPPPPRESRSASAVPSSAPGSALTEKRGGPFRGCLACVGANDVAGDELGVFSDAEKERRFALVEPVQAHEVATGGGGDAAYVPRPAIFVEQGQLDPAEVWSVSVCPEDRRDPGSVEIDFTTSLARRRFRGLRIAVGRCVRDAELGGENVLVAVIARRQADERRSSSE
jgi:hypothetical protein